MRSALNEEWQKGWHLVAASVIETMLPNTYGGTLGVLMPGLSRDFGWSRAQISASVLIICAGLLVLGPVAGCPIDRLGLRRTALIGVISYCGAIFTVRISGPSIVTWYLAWTLVAVASPMTNNLVWPSAINRSFRKQRGLALSVGLSAVGLGTLISPLVPRARWQPSAGGQLISPWRCSGFCWLRRGSGYCLSRPIRPLHQQPHASTAPKPWSAKLLTSSATRGSGACSSRRCWSPPESARWRFICNP